MEYVNRWQLKTRMLNVGQIPLLMGIVNVTPDSFSDGGKFYGTSTAIEHALQLASDGADILDVGGESTRPYSDPVAVEEELSRVVPVIEGIVAESEVPISVDTSKSVVARAALAAGAEIINDVTGLEGDPEMLHVAIETRAGLCAMHMQGTPQTMQDDPSYGDVVEDIFHYLGQRVETLVEMGIDRERICLDPGIGFGKTHAHNLELLRRCDRFLDLRCPILVGHSRKGFLAKIIGDQDADRTAATVGVSLAMAMKGIQVLRIHDIRPTREALQTFSASGGMTRVVG